MNKNVPIKNNREKSIKCHKMVPCTQEHKIGTIEADLKTLIGTVPRLNETVIRLEENVKILSKNTGELLISVEYLKEVQSISIGELKATQRIKTSQRWLIGLLIASGVSIVALIVDIWK
jgi:hypothetical protein